jgi:hypothetical protein
VFPLTAAEVWQLAQELPALLHPFFPRDDPQWMAFLLHVSILKRMTAASFVDDMPDDPSTYAWGTVDANPSTVNYENVSLVRFLLHAPCLPPPPF